MNLRPGCFHSAAGPVLFGKIDALPFTCLFTPVARPIEPIAADKLFIDCHYIVDEHGEVVPAFKIHPTSLVDHGAIRGYLCFYDAAGNVIHTWH